MKSRSIRGYKLLISIILLLVTRHALCQDYQKFTEHYPLYYKWTKTDLKKKLKNRGYLGAFKKHDVIADIGAYSGNVALAISTQVDSLTFYLQECQPDRLNPNGFQEAYKHFSASGDKPITSDFKFVIGDQYHSNLPDTSCDAILLNNTFEYIANADLYLKDLKTKLKPKGKIYVTTDNPYKPDYFIKIFEAYGFTCEKNSSGGGMTRLVFTPQSKDVVIKDVFDAVIKKDIQKTQELLNKGKVNARLGQVGLVQIASSISDNEEIITLLIKNGAIVNPYNEHSFSFTPLSKAAASGNYKTTKLLLENGAKPTTEDLQMAAWFGQNPEVVKLLVANETKIHGEKGTDNSALYFASLGGNLEIFKFLVDQHEKTSGLDQKDTCQKSEFKGQSIVHWAAQSPNVELLKYLIDNKGIDINTTDDNGMTVLMHAVFGGCLNTIKYLVEDKKADTKIKNNDGLTAFNYALSPEIRTYLEAISK